MKNLVLKKTILIAVALLVVAVSAFALFACNKPKSTPVTLGDVYLDTTSPNEFTSYKTEFVLPAGWEVYTLSTKTSSEALNANSDIGYIKDMDAFVVAKDGILSIVKCGDSRVYIDGGIKGMLFPQSIGITALRAAGGVIVCKFSNGEAGAFDYNGNTLISRKRVSGAGSANIDKVIKNLGGGLVAIAASYDVQGKSGYTSIYRTTTSGEMKDRGELVCRVKNTSNDLSKVSGFEGGYVSVIGNSEGAYMFAIPAHASNPVQNLDGGNGYIAKESLDDYYAEITYIGGGRFFVHEDWTVDSTENYTYYDGNDYYVFRRKIYSAANDSLSDYTANSDKVFLKLTNKYYGTEKSGIDVKQYLKDGYMYAAYGLNIVNKKGLYDQYILDSDLNVVMSLTGNFGTTLDGQDKEEVSVFDLVMTAADGNYYVPYLPSKVAIYDKDGNKKGENTKYRLKSQNIAGGVIIACIEDPDGSDDDMYTLFDLKGNEITAEYTLESGQVRNQKYTQIAAFRGFYSVARRPNEDGVETYYLIGRDGVEIETMTDGTAPLADMATTATKTAIFKIGCYMFKKQSTDANGNTVTLYGVKNFNANSSKNLIMEASMESGAVLYAPSASPTDVFVFEKITGADSTFTYAVHRLV